ncbi:flagellin-like protein [Halarchaeum rubridurum]|uniref:Flagellin n=1 Tax=Halarchaeum rubridurum TaxID=489911 RepID=A0A830G194_9EURY|nr:archaellin/type IV pilin N-terminal domain-containing protein [Halarchaeum rubridurum]MBP1954909.1 flagellin-like protein [Halarchaeum rubridurum]GGM70429.1 hypothetical protein GCM10009017_20810 [Halarchaeum rubridurum]
MELSLPDFDYERGQVGIETLVVFIAMILVAAIAATVLINTTGFLQNKASATSQDSAQQVSNQVVVISGVGDVHNNSSGEKVVNQTELTVMQSPGADSIDLGGSTIKWIGPHGAQTLTYADNASAADAEFSVSAIRDEDGSLPVLNEKTDRMKLNIALDKNADALKPLQAGEDATIQIVTQSGSQYTYVASTPQTLSSQSDGGAVSL